MYLTEFIITSTNQMDDIRGKLMKKFAQCLQNNIKMRFVNKEMTENKKIFSIERIYSLVQMMKVEDQMEYQLEILIDHYGIDLFR